MSIRVGIDVNKKQVTLAYVVFARSGKVLLVLFVGEQIILGWISGSFRFRV